MTSVLANTAKFVKAHKLISRGLALSGNPLLQLASKGAAQIGLGKKRKPRKRKAQRGKGIFSSILGEIGGGIGSGLGNLGRGFFGGGKKKKGAKKLIKL